MSRGPMRPVNRGTKESRARAALYGEPMTDPWRELYDREYPRLVRALVAIGRDPAGAEDAAQEAFVKAHRTGLDHIAKPAAWLLVVGSREVFRRRRRSRRERELWASLPERHDAIASHFDIKGGTVGATLHQAIERLRKIQLAGRLARGAMR